MPELTDAHYNAILKQTAFNLFIGNAERRGRRFGLSNRAVSQTMSSLRDELFDIDRDSKPVSSPDVVVNQVAKLIATLKPSADTPASDPPEAPVTLESIHALIVPMADRLTAIENRK